MCRSNVIMINGSVWVARFGAVICGISFCSFSLYVYCSSRSYPYCFQGGHREFWCILKREPQVHQSDATLVCRTSSLSRLLPSVSVSCNVQRGAGDIITLCLFSGPFCDRIWVVVDCKMISGTEAALCRRCI